MPPDARPSRGRPPESVRELPIVLCGRPHHGGNSCRRYGTRSGSQPRRIRVSEPGSRRREFIVPENCNQPEPLRVHVKSAPDSAGPLGGGLPLMSNIRVPLAVAHIDGIGDGDRTDRPIRHERSMFATVG